MVEAYSELEFALVFSKDRPDLLLLGGKACCNLRSDQMVSHLDIALLQSTNFSSCDHGDCLVASSSSSKLVEMMQLSVSAFCYIKELRRNLSMESSKETA